MSNDLRILYQGYSIECKFENSIELSGNVLSMLFVLCSEGNIVRTVSEC